MLLRLIALIYVTLTCLNTTNAQSTTLDVDAANPQNTRVLNTRGLEVMPSKVLWKSEKLFTYRATDPVTYENGPFRFKLDLPTGEDYSTPIIAGDLLYFTYGGYNGYLYAIERDTGKKLSILQFDRNSVSKPAAKDNIVFFGSGSGQVHAYDFKKKEKKWTFVDKDHSFSQSFPIHDGELLYFYAVNRGLYAFVAATGEVKWLFKSTPFVYEPAIVGDRVFLLTAPGRLIAVDRNSGTKQWDVSVGRNSTTPAILGDQIFLVYNDGEIRSYSTSDGGLQWKSKGVPRCATLVALHNGLVYYGGKDDSLIAIDAKTGAEKLRFETKRPCFSPVIAGELLYVRCQDKKMYALSTSTLKEVWQVDNRKVVAPPVVFADGVMYSLGSDGYLYAMK